MNRDEAIKLLRGGAKGVAEWNRRRRSKREEIPSLSKALVLRSDLSGANLTGLDLTGGNFTESNLCRAKLGNADLRGAKFRAANLTRANLHCANLGEANLYMVDLTEADLNSADLTAASLNEATLRAALFTSASLINASLRDADLTGANLQRANLRGAKFNCADLTCANFQQADCREANFTNVTFDNITGTTPANLSDADLTDATFTRESNATYWGGFLELASCRGLDSATFSDPSFLPSYTARAFHYAHGGAPEDQFPDFVSAALDRIKELRQVLDGVDPPESLVQVVQEITAELINYLKAHPNALYDIKPRQFEELIAEILAHYGWQVRLTAASKDGGYDLFAITKDVSGVESAWIIECKKYAPDRKVGVDIVRSLFGVKGDLKVANAMLATTSHFTKGVKDYKASRYDLDLRDYEGVLEWINEYKPNPNGRLYIRDNKLVLPGE